MYKIWTDLNRKLRDIRVCMIEMEKEAICMIILGLIIIIGTILVVMVEILMEETNNKNIIECKIT